jgi:hypothetical protein
MRVALFVEGSIGVPDRHGKDFFVELWRATLVKALGLRAIDFVFPISKKHIIALDPANPKMSGASEGLDELMARKLKHDPFDAAIVAWDLHPGWIAASAPACRRRETVDFYRLLGKSTSLPQQWAVWAAAKSADLSSRIPPSNRASPPKLCKHGTFAVCMEPVFEALLLASESGIKRALGVDGVHVPGWPASWNVDGVSRPEITILQAAILAAKQLTPRKRNAHIVSGDMRTAKHEWAKRLVDLLSDDVAARDMLLQHPIACRLIELLSRG